MLLSFIKPEFLILVPVLFLIKKILKESFINNKMSCLIINLFSIFLTSMWTFATLSITCFKQILSAIFISVSQGILIVEGSGFLKKYISRYIQQKNIL